MDARSLLPHLFGPGTTGERGALWPRWLFLRALGLIFFSAFYSLAFQIKGLIGLDGLLPAAAYLEMVARAFPGGLRFWCAPTLLWLGAGNGALTALVWGGLIASALLTVNVWPRGMIAACLILFLSFIGAAQDFASYQSDGMLLEAAFLSIFFAPRGFWPGLGADQPPSRITLFLLRWEWFRIYFESGVVKLASGDPQWRGLTAMDHYYENGPLPSWIGWYVQQRLPHAFHAGTALATLIVELGLVWLAWLPRPFRLACFAICTLLQVGIILTANYAFLNYLVLVLGFLLLDDGVLAKLRLRVPAPAAIRPVARWRMAAAAVVLAWIFYATLVPWLAAGNRMLAAPARALEPFRIANQYGLFAVMTPERYEIEFQGSRDGTAWIAYPFRYKPQDLREAPGLYAPYQPRFEWNLWFASLGSVGQNTWVENTEIRLLEGSRDVLGLFRRDPFTGSPPAQVRAVLWQYGFTTPEEKRKTGRWWWRQELSLYAPVMERTADGSIGMR
ncbi:MAG TPA: lipase maturation factor family protein [Thermoanaerobaculia bacterium]|nr:lipase maturation factor family protein [Thermoanaerobaculia bacterium]